MLSQYSELTSPSFLHVLGTLSPVARSQANLASRAKDAPRPARHAKVSGTPAAAYATVANRPAAVRGDTLPYPFGIKRLRFHTVDSLEKSTISFLLLIEYRLLRHP